MKKATKQAAKRRATGSRNERSSRKGRIRLGCIYCDRDDFDGVDQLPDDWAEVSRVQSYAESIREIEPDDTSRDICFWETHTGICPECQQQEAEEGLDA